MDLLPGDVLADVLGRLAPRSLAACRSVCKAWHTTIDAHGLLREDLLPLSLAGIYVVYVHLWTKQSPPTFFSRPSIGARIQGNLSYLDAFHDEWSWSCIGTHCNGLILLQQGIVNPATWQWARLPPYPDLTQVKGFGLFDFLAFDPTVSPHFEVFFMHCVLHRYFHNTELDTASPDSEWPPSPYVMSAFSSRTWRWEERSFTREGMAIRSVANVEPFLPSVYRHDAVYWRGRLYVYHIYFIVRLCLEDNKYRVIQLPRMNEACRQVDNPHLGISKNGVYYGFSHDEACKLQMWFLDESTNHTEWTLTHAIDLMPTLAKFPWKHGDGSWSVQGVNHEALEKEELEWDSDNEDGTIAISTEVSVQNGLSEYITILGFHPYKEIIFLHTTWSTRVMAYHLNSSKLEDLGSLPLGDEIWSSCTYTPCWMESCLRANSSEANIEM